MLIDANLLLYAVDRASPFHEAAAAWLTEQLNGPRQVALPWQSLVAFLRISTNPRASASPLTSDDAVTFLEDWLRLEVVWVPTPGSQHSRLFGELVRRYQLQGNMISDAHLAALALEHGLALYSADTDFARFRELTWINPLR
jgi:uncharacterized protein